LINRTLNNPEFKRIECFIEDVPATSNLLENQGTQDKRSLCRNTNKGTYQEKSSQCKDRPERCINYESRTNSERELTYVKEDMADGKGNLHTDDSNRTRSDSSSSTSSLFSMSSIQSTYTRSKLCLYGVECFNVNCTFNHPNGWNPCIDGEKCENYECAANHPRKRKAKCHDHNRCKVSNCKFLHPKTRVKECNLRARCKRWDCPKLHPRTRARPCPNKKNCTNLTCLCLHPPERAALLCLFGVDCRDLSCRLNHPPERPSVCDQPDICPNFNCTHLHRPEWNPCEAGDECEDEQCSKIHTFERITVQQKETASSTNISIKNRNQKTKKKYLKTLEQRIKDREKTQLPILSYQKEFCQRLEHERILIVTAETGSGKSTQLPQYAAEYFGSLVVCTQPRVVAALSLARRVAEEYDGKSVGESVGYQAGNANRVRGTDIMFMTDAALIRESQRDSSLKHVRVLIVDEAHDRSLNTDIVIGISKLLLAQRPDDFYVVIASATIDPTRFLQFFDRPASAPLEVKGRVFSVTKDEKPPPSNCSDQKLIVSHIVPSVVELYPQYQGHTLVFLPGQGEIEQALKIFKSMLPDDCVALPLYGSQSPEDQEKVIKFNETDKRMVVFCTNVAETSLTIPNVRLVIDSGLAKEARYDVKRRLTVIETVRISRSSADQRKGRAGRTASGHCVRLYEDKELIRPNIEPEILRSSLDLVLLQLIRLNFDPKTFPFMDQPQNDSISYSLDLLTKLKCVDEQQITKRGELFTELALDPRLSAFIVDIYTEYKSLLDLAVAIVAILSAPGTVFFMGGATQEAKQEAKARVALEAHNYKSDLLHLYSVYDQWKHAGGQEIQGKCSKCYKLYMSSET
jgi:superfamily II DNA/RNA helicase